MSLSRCPIFRQQAAKMSHLWAVQRVGVVHIVYCLCGKFMSLISYRQQAAKMSYFWAVHGVGVCQCCIPLVWQVLVSILNITYCQVKSLGSLGKLYLFESTSCLPVCIIFTIAVIHPEYTWLVHSGYDDFLLYTSVYSISSFLITTSDISNIVNPISLYITVYYMFVVKFTKL